MNLSQISRNDMSCLVIGRASDSKADDPDLNVSLFEFKQRKDSL